MQTPSIIRARLASVLAALSALFIATAEASAKSDLYSGLDAASFRELPGANAAIDLAAIDNELLAAAVFHETNRVRLEHALGLLRFEPKVQAAARAQSDIMAVRGTISHVNPGHPGQRTPEDRLKSVNLELAYAAENVATMFGLAHKSGSPFYIREEAGRTVPSLEPNGPPIPAHTYVSFAAALVQSWMDSPGHRKNILDEKAAFLGCSCVRGENQGAMPVFYCTQVFFAPLPAAGPPSATIEASAAGFDIEPFRKAALEKWEKDIAALEAKDRTESHPADSILFVGSSSIRLWPDIAADMAPYPAIQRGYGGAKFTDLVFFAERLIYPHQFRALVVFVANDITGSSNDRTPAEIAALFDRFHAIVRKKYPATPTFYVAVTPSGSRIKSWPTIRAGNLAVQARCRALPNTHFIATESIYLKADGTADDSLFRDDRLHQNQKGYDRWAAAIKSQLDTHLPE